MRSSLARLAAWLPILKRDKTALLSLVAGLAAILLIVYSLIVRVQMFSLGTSLWNDEALLADNIVGKSFAQILTPPMSNLPTTSAGYLIIEKGLVHVFGTAEWVLRLYSLIALVLLLIVQGIVLRKVFHTPLVFALLSVALSSVFYYYMNYSAEVKPYMGDALFSVLVILMYFLFRRGRIGPVILGLSFSVCLVMSSPAVFFVAGTLLVEFAAKLRRRDFRSARRVILAGAICLAVFIVHYLLWLRPISTVPELTSFWQWRAFDFRLWRSGALSRDLGLVSALFLQLGAAKLLLLCLAGGGGSVFAVQERYPHIIACRVISDVGRRLGSRPVSHG